MQCLLDLHERTPHIIVLDGATDRVVMAKNILTTTERFDDEVAPFAPSKVLVDSSTPARRVSERLRAQGHEVIVGNPNFAMMCGSRPLNRKNDRADAKALERRV